jgi:hypothetical protein
VLGIHGPLNLFGRSGDAVIRIRFRRGLVTTTPVPPLASNGPMYFVAASNSVLIRPLDYVPGYLVRDGRRAVPTAHALDCGPAIPGPEVDQVWVTSCGLNPRRLQLTSVFGDRVSSSLRVPSGRSPVEAASDGRGWLLFRGYPGSGGPAASLDVRPGRTSVITRGQLLAVGPTRWLTQRCRVGICRAVVSDRQDRTVRTLPGPLPPVSESGLISPNGTAAALVTTTSNLVWVDLRTGAFRALPLTPDVSDRQTTAWSPDSKWLFVLDRSGVLYAIEGRTGRVVANLTTQLRLPPLHQLAIRDLTAR